LKKEQLHKELRSGYTTGTCATAVAKAATWMLLQQNQLDHVHVTLPDNQQVILDINLHQLNTDIVKCGTVKDAGDDPDVTHGLEIIAQARYISECKTSIKGGDGIGQVTKPGLAVPVGQPAINPVPLQMITQAVEELRPENKGIEVTISAPGGDQIAQRTFNPQLGIVGGISILGTTGIVKPMSEEGLKNSLVVKLQQLAAWGYNKAIFCPGNYGKTFSEQQFQYDEEKIVLTSNYIGFMLEQAVKNGFKKIILIGHLGKLVKLAGGIFQTHSRTADARNEILAAHYLQYSNNVESFKQIMSSNTTEEATEFVADPFFWNHLSTLIKTRAERYIYNELEVEIILFSQHKGMLGHTDNALSLMENIYTK
jgi:cobalt-precorrin-5B (C1)-methyltransferase